MSNCMVIDQKKCVGCHACAVACKAANGTPPSASRSRVVREAKGTYPDVKMTITPMLCMQCSSPACVPVCPVEATWVNDEGVVVVDKSVCIGCGTCVEACPYMARHVVRTESGYFGDELTAYEAIAYEGMPDGTADKCNWCAERREAGGNPACVDACPYGARSFGSREELDELIASRDGQQLHPDLGTDPNVWYLPALES